MKKKVTQETEVASRYESYTRDELVKLMDMHIDGVPADAKDTIRFKIDVSSEPYSDSEYPQLYITWQRDETDSEYEKRLKQESQWSAMRTEHERKEYERLSKIYGGKK